MGLIAYSYWLSSTDLGWHLGLYWNQGKCTLSDEDEDDITLEMC
jgi:hypothetical protein